MLGVKSFLILNFLSPLQQNSLKNYCRKKIVYICTFLCVFFVYCPKSLKLPSVLIKLCNFFDKDYDYDDYESRIMSRLNIYLTFDLLFFGV